MCFAALDDAETGGKFVGARVVLQIPIRCIQNLPNALKVGWPFG